MSLFEKTFIAKSTVKSHDIDHKRKINFNIGKYDEAVPKGKKQFRDTEYIRELAKQKKWEAIENLDYFLELFEKNCTANGGKVLWAEDSVEALEHIEKICKEKNCKTVVKSKSMVTEEIHLNGFLQNIGIESIETDLGEYIQQLDGEPPYHIVTPAMHKNKDDCAKVFAGKLGTSRNITPEEITKIVRKNHRVIFQKAEIGITGANFILPDIGGIAISENEGNARIGASLPETHVVIVGIEKVIPSVHDLALFWPLLSTYGTGQYLTVYNSIITGPKKKQEYDGPKELYVILLDNKRTTLFSDPVKRESLYCIRCGACLNACPIYKNIGGHTYGTTYTGPIGKVVSPHLEGIENYGHLSFSSSLCGSCTEVCPVKIQLHDLILNNRQETVKASRKNLADLVAWQLWKKAALSRKLFNLTNGTLKNKVVNNVFKGWNKQRSDLTFSPKTFNQMWKEGQSN